MLDRRTAVATGLAKGGRDGASGARTCRIGVIHGWSLLQVAGFPNTKGDVEAILNRHLGAMPPDRIGKVVAAGTHTLLRTGPNQVWILGDEGDDLHATLTDDIDGAIGALTALSHSRTRIFVEGEPARDVLCKGIAIDLDPNVFNEGSFALTGLHHTPVLLLRAGPVRYEIWAMRSFAHTIWEWLADAAWSVGYEVAEEPN